jgi:hypothetical protein
MSPELVVILSGTLTFGVPLVVAVREVIVTKRGGGWRPERLPDPRPVKPLPPCLLPPFPPLARLRAPSADAPRHRVLEDA